MTGRSLSTYQVNKKALVTINFFLKYLLVTSPNIKKVKHLFEHRLPTFPDEARPSAIFDSSGRDLVAAFGENEDCSLTKCHSGCCPDFVEKILKKAKGGQPSDYSSSLKKGILLV